MQWASRSRRWFWAVWLRPAVERLLSEIKSELKRLEGCPWVCVKSTVQSNDRFSTHLPERRKPEESLAN